MKSLIFGLAILTIAPCIVAAGETHSDEWGLTVIDDTTKKVVVTHVEPGSPAAQVGLKPGDVIEEANLKPLGSVSDFTKAVELSKGRSSLHLFIRRGNFGSTFILVKAR